MTYITHIAKEDQKESENKSGFCELNHLLEYTNKVAWWHIDVGYRDEHVAPSPKKHTCC